MNVDLHLHSTASDGTLPPADVVSAAAEAGLHVIALTDHDTVAGVGEGRQSARRVGTIEVIPAIEVSTSLGGSDLHILGYFVDPEHPELQGHVESAAHGRQSRMRRMVERLKEQGVDVPFERVTAEAVGAPMGRPHLARALVAEGIVGSVPLAFDLYIGNDRPAYIPSSLLDTGEALGLIQRAGGVAVWAHPPRHLVSSLLPGLRESGLGGLEVYRPRWSPDRVLQLEEAARTWGLLVSGGSDWHGPDDGPLGDFCVPSSDVQGLLEVGGL
mgnify:CR=1 FL=1